MELIEVEKQSPIGFYGLTFRCSSCGAQLNEGYNCQGMFGFDRQALNLLSNSRLERTSCIGMTNLGSPGRQGTCQMRS